MIATVIINSTSVKPALVTQRPFGLFRPLCLMLGAVPEQRARQVLPASFGSQFQHEIREFFA